MFSSLADDFRLVMYSVYCEHGQIIRYDVEHTSVTDHNHKNSGADDAAGFISVLRVDNVSHAEEPFHYCPQGEAGDV